MKAPLYFGWFISKDLYNTMKSVTVDEGVINDFCQKKLGHRTFVWVTPICCGHALMTWNAAGFLLG
jgi:hypothetical protein